MTPDDPATMEALKTKAPEAAELLRQLSNANRLLILCHISQEERSVGELEQDLGIKQPGLSQQLAELRQSGLVKTRRESRSIFYSIADDRAQAVMTMLYEVFCRQGKGLKLAPSGTENPRTVIRGDTAQFARVSRPPTTGRP